MRSPCDAERPLHASEGGWNPDSDPAGAGGRAASWLHSLLVASRRCARPRGSVYSQRILPSSPAVLRLAACPEDFKLTSARKPALACS